MYINFKILVKSGVNAQQLLILQGIKQKEYDMFEKALPHLEKLKENGFLTTIKGEKTQALYTKFRLSKKGKNFLRDLEIAEITEESLKLSAELISLYEDEGLDIKNKKKIVELTSWFLSETGFNGDDVYQTVSDYINSTEKTYVSNLNNLIWKGESAFSTKWNLSQSKLYGMMTND